MPITQDIAVNYVLPSLALVAVVLIYLGHRTTSPLLAIFSRWIRWVLIAFFAASLMVIINWPERPYWAIYCMTFFGWFLIETGYNWLAIDALSKSNYPLFPRFRENTKGDEWPNIEQFIDLKDELRGLKYTRIKALYAVLDEDLGIRSSIYESEDKCIRLQILFFPHQSGRVTVSFALTSTTADGARLITDNFFLPFGGFYPEDWHLERRPWLRKLSDLLRRHKSRMDEFASRYKTSFVLHDSDPLDDINTAQRTLERINTEIGFLTPIDEREEHGRISWEGRYRVWKELWLLSYLGISGR